MEVNKNIPVLFQKIKDYEVDDLRFTKVKIWLMHLNENLNGSYFSKEVVEEAIPTLANTPILGFIEKNSLGEVDFSDHRMVLSMDENGTKIEYLGQAIGCIPESNNAKFEFRLCDDGVEREFLTVEGLLWNKWDAPIDIFNRDLIKAQSMELADDYDGEFQDDNLFHFTRFKFFGACVLGKDVLPAMVNSTIEKQFSYQEVFNDIQSKMEQFKQYMSQREKGGNNLNFATKKEDYGTGEKLEIDNSKDSANMSGSWGDVDKTKLRNDILKASNYKSVVKEAYLIVEEGWEDKPSEALKYPHHEISGGKLIVHKGGCEAALVRLHGQNITSGDAIDHLKKHYRELGLDMSNFEKQDGVTDNKDNADGTDNKSDGNSNNNNNNFSLTSQQLADELEDELEEVTFLDEDWWGDPVENQRYYYMDHDDQFVYVYDDAEDAYFKIPYSMNGDEVEIDYEKASRIKWSPVDWEGQDDEQTNFVKNYKKCLMSKFEEKHKQEMDKSNEEHQKMMDKMEEMMKEMKGQMADLMQFKENKLKAEKEAEINKVFEQFSKQLTADEIAPLREKAMEMDIEVLRKELYAMVGMKLASFNANAKPKFNVMGINLKPDDKIGETVWDKYKSKI